MPTTFSDPDLVRSEDALFGLIKNRKVVSMITTPSDITIKTLKVTRRAFSQRRLVRTYEARTPVVVIHGLWGGMLVLANLLDALSDQRTVYVIDLPGFGRSSRTEEIPKGAEAAEGFFVQAIQEWVGAMGLEHIILLGHSFGGFLSTAYALSQPSCLRHLILIDPWGFHVNNEGDENPLLDTFLKRYLHAVYPDETPMHIIRACPQNLGRAMLKQKIRDFRRAFGPLKKEITTYIHQSNLQVPSGEKMFSQMADDFYWARMPMLNRLDSLRTTLPVTMILGKDSWIPTEIGDEVLRIRKAHTTIYKIQNCGHNVFCDQPRLFCQIVLRAAFAGVKKKPRRPVIEL